MRKTAGYTFTDYKTNTQITKELKITPILNKLLEYKRKWIQHVNRMPRNRLPRVMKHYSPTGRTNHGRPLKRLLDTWDRNGSTSGPTPWQIYDDDDLKCFHVSWRMGKSVLFITALRTEVSSSGITVAIAMRWTLFADLLRTRVLVLHLILPENYINKSCLFLEDLLPHYMSGAFTNEANDVFVLQVRPPTDIIKLKVGKCKIRRLCYL